VIGVAALVKLTALLALVGLVPWMLTRIGRRDAIRTATACLGVVVAGLVLAAASVHTLLAANHNISRASTWNVFNHYLATGHQRRAGAWPVAEFRVAAMITVIALAIAVAMRLRDRRQPFLAVGAATGAYAAGGPYVLPWYALWALPLFAITRRSALATIAAVYAGVVLASYQLPQSNPHSPWDPLFRWTTTIGAPLPLFVAFAVAALLHSGRPYARREARELAGAA
jgi:hypothetical protein